MNFSKTDKTSSKQQTSSKDTTSSRIYETPTNIQMAGSFRDVLSESELKYFLNNMVNDEDVEELQTRYSPTICEYCSKLNLPTSSSCCEPQELRAYLQGVESRQLTEQLSTFFLLKPRNIRTGSTDELEEVKRFIIEDNYRHGLNMDAPPGEEDAVDADDGKPVKLKLKKSSMKTFLKIKNKMDRFKIYWPQLFNRQEDALNVWGNMSEEPVKDVNISAGPSVERSEYDSLSYESL